VIFYPGFQIKDIIISGNQKVTSKDIESLVYENINNKILSVLGWTLSSKSIFLVNPDDLNKKILSKFPIIESAKIDKKFPQTLSLQINERIPAAIFCPSLDESVGECYFTDGSGLIFESLSTIPQNMAIVRQTVNDNKVFVGEKIVQQNIMDLLSKVETTLENDFKIDVKEVLVTSPLRINFKTTENWQIYFDLGSDSDVNLQLVKLNLLLTGGISQDSRENLRYIDLRPKDRAIICDNSTCGK